MLVRGQSAPRAQVIHRDGEHAFICSIGDLLAYLEVPSPHGAPEQVFVEIMEPTEDPLESHTAPHPWIPAEEAVYLVGIARRGIMGPPVLVYRTRADAEQVAAGSSATILDFDGLREWWRHRDDAEPIKAELSGHSMGTTWSVIASLPADRIHDVEAAQSVIEQRLERIERLMSTWDRDSELSRFNRHASTAPFPLSAETLEVLSLAQQVSEETGGAFDATVGPLVSAWGFGAGASDETRFPDAVEVAQILERVGFHLLAMNRPESTAHKRRADVVCDLSGIAKGFAVDVVVQALSEIGWVDFVVELGGDVRASGRRTDGQPWRVGIERPDALGRVVHSVVELADRAMATSGDYRHFRTEATESEPDVRLSHVVDPRTGRPVSHTLASVSVVHEDAALADAWATALLVLGLESGRELAEAEGIAAYFISRLGGDTFAAEATRRFPEVHLPSELSTELPPFASTVR
jgi:thiamine biosynthesis lipoprotein